VPRSAIVRSADECRRQVLREGRNILGAEESIDVLDVGRVYAVSSARICSS
jgi:hypothetical protein